jgi:hypothetical protein
MGGHPFIGLSFVNGTVYGKYGHQNAGEKNPGHCQKNIDCGKTQWCLTDSSTGKNGSYPGMLNRNTVPAIHQIDMCA